MDAVASTLGNGVHDGPAESSIFSVETIGDQPELLNRIQIGLNAGLKIGGARHIASIYEEAVAVFALAVYGDRARTFVARGGGRHTSLQA